MCIIWFYYRLKIDVYSMNLWNKIDTDSRNNSSQKRFQISNTLSSLFTYCILNYLNVLFKYLSRKKFYFIPGESGAWSCRQVQREERQEQGFRHRKPKSQAGFSPSSLKSISGIFKTRVFAATMLSAGPKLRLGPMDIGPKQKVRGKIKVICPIGKISVYIMSLYTHWFS